MTTGTSAIENKKQRNSLAAPHPLLMPDIESTNLHLLLMPDIESTNQCMLRESLWTRYCQELK